MCDCYDTFCEVCKKGNIPVHIVDFCISRDYVKIYCQKHIPKKEVVIHKIVEDEYRYKSELAIRKRKGNPVEYPLGWKMGVRYLEKPPFKYGYGAVTPNVCAEHIAKVIPKRGSPFWITEWTKKNYTTEIGAVEYMINSRDGFSPSEQTWRRYSIKLKGSDVLKKLNLQGDVLKEIKIVSKRLKKRYKNILAIILIGSFAEGNAEKDSDIDIVIIRQGKKHHASLWKIIESAKGRIQIIPFDKKTLDYHFENSTTMAYAIQRGKIIYEKNGFLRKYYTWHISYPNSKWMEEWFNHWVNIYSYGIKDFKRNRKMKFDFVSDCLSRAVVNFAILFIETRGYIPTTKKDLAICFNREIKDKEIMEGFRIALQAHHEDRDPSLNEAGKIYNVGKFLKEELKNYFQKVKEHEASLDNLNKLLKRK